MIRTRAEAYRILGLNPNATGEQIKIAYKEMVKKYHPDVTGNDDSTVYNLVVEAYEFLTGNTVANGNRIVENRTPRVTPTGNVNGGSQFRKTASKSDYAAFQKKIKRQQKQKAVEFEQKQKEYSEKIKKQDADYKRAMDAIEAIRAARAIEAMVWANGLGKEKGHDTKEPE